MDNVSILEKERCTGCGLCKNICPFGAIDMLADKEGFLRPAINEKCTNCGLCAKKCPALSKVLNVNKKFETFAVWSNDNLRPLGSSGGVFPALAEYFIDNDGVVFGAAFESGCKKLSHQKVESKKDLSILYKSKYVQSDTKYTYKEVKECLEGGKKVLYCGCPCQIDALKTYLGKNYDTLLTIDILCHGAPSPYAYNKFLEEVSKGREVIDVDFRDKTPGWGTLIRVDFSDGSVHHDLYNGNYFRAFLSGIAMRDSCYTCPYSQEHRPGDLTIGDFWGVSEFKKDWNDNKGTSIVLVNNEKGDEFLKKIKKSISRIEKVPYKKTIEICEKHNGALLFPTKSNKMHGCFFRHLNEGEPFSIALKYAEKGLLDVGILGWWIDTPKSNYGSNLTDFALYQYLQTLNLSVAFISPANFDRNNAGEFNKKYGYRMTMKYSKNQMNENNKYFKTYIVASDTLWYYDAMILQGWNFLLDFAGDDKRKISYATSFGNTNKFFPENEIPYAKYLMHRFDHIGVREFEGVDICKNKFDIEATQVMDPVFLADMSDWEMVANNAPRKTKGDYLFSYVLDPNYEKGKDLKELADKLGLKLVTVTDRQNNLEEREKILKNYGILSHANIEEFVYHLMNAKFIVADSFHGFCFALIFNKPFVALVNRTRGSSRFDTLSKIVGCESRMIETLKDTKKWSVKELMNIEFDKYQENIKKATERSKMWLKKALFSERTEKKISKDILLEKEIYDTKKKIATLEEKIKNLENKLN
ncbi:MAG: Coenzyme F420 hydrogenase/dehydrogenase, beta subunit C-terminal domain [Clostridia bacterium]|nr:Coenzyme F420 hydrogenase/dehydrogenase, beta subunit C-terminal domain [Clostridia bacterium]